VFSFATRLAIMAKIYFRYVTMVVTEFSLLNFWLYFRGEQDPSWRCAHPGLLVEHFEYRHFASLHVWAIW